MIVDPRAKQVSDASRRHRVRTGLAMQEVDFPDPDGPMNWLALNLADTPRRA